MRETKMKELEFSHKEISELLTNETDWRIDNVMVYPEVVVFRIIDERSGKEWRPLKK
jgi:hypothetical protein